MRSLDVIQTSSAPGAGAVQSAITSLCLRENVCNLNRPQTSNCDPILAPAFKVVKPQGTYLAWLDVSQVAQKIGASELAAEASKAAGRPVTPETMVERYFVKNAKVHMNQGASYGYGGAGRMRMNIATSRKTLELALSNLASALRRA